MAQTRPGHAHLHTISNFRRMKLSKAILTALVMLVVSCAVSAQDGQSAEELEKLLEEQRSALEEAIAQREATAAQVEEIKKELSQSEEVQQRIEEELKTLCEEQESLEAGKFDSCMNNSDS